MMYINKTNHYDCFYIITYSKKDIQSQNCNAFVMGEEKNYLPFYKTTEPICTRFFGK